VTSPNQFSLVPWEWQVTEIPGPKPHPIALTILEHT
jgi:hypothetical protein